MKFFSMSSTPNAKPAVAATPALYLLYRLHEFKQRCKDRRTGQTVSIPPKERQITERDLQILNRKIDKLLRKLDKIDTTEPSPTKDEECVVCLARQAVICTYPCTHRVICRKCFVKTIQMALSQRLLPLRCVVCRSKIKHLEQAPVVDPL
ncbi:uncharacterized protein LOC765039 [Strongylocentrotus purpuratus]|uniref:RING-type domain-containing protein n=1 Tax=Strongylocentrotus purpuratus TaxID=7668 RepID=A0A7M7G1J4_STRPU|nr:uncharacterized protein LOC765039 [Strongylocentrotus purpuratus]|eukprot:XP_001201921.2 PREDICTED: uncharacterized protein LOC765039 [Strongylocentrotus purpuratus]